MKRLYWAMLTCFSLILLGCGGGSSGGAGTALNLTGTWKLQTATDQAGFVGGTATVNLVQSGNSVSGTFTQDPTAPGTVDCLGDGTVNGSVSGNTVILQFNGRGGTISGRMTGTSNSLSGTGTAVFNGTTCTGAVSGSAVMVRV